MDTQKTVQRPLFLEPGGGEHYHFLNHLATVKVAGGIEGQLSVVEFLAPKGFGPPLHRPNYEDELFVVLAGEIVLRRTDTESLCRRVGLPCSREESRTDFRCSRKRHAYST